MELDDLKNRWQQETDAFTNLNHKDMAHLENLLQAKTSSLVQVLHRKYERIITSMLLGMVLFVVGVPLLTDTPYADSGKLYLPYFMIILPLLLFYWFRFREIAGTVPADRLQPRLVQLIARLRRSRWQEMLLVVGLAVLFTGWRFVFGKGLTDIMKPEVLIGYPLVLLFTGLMLRYSYRRYERYIRELQAYLAEIGENK